MQKSLPPAAPSVDFSAYQVKDPVELGRNILQAMETVAKVWVEMMEKQAAAGVQPKMPSIPNADDLPQPAKALATLWQTWLKDPARLSEAQGELVAGYLQVWQNALHKVGGVDSHPVKTISSTAILHLPSWQALLSTAA